MLLADDNEFTIMHYALFNWIIKVTVITKECSSQKFDDMLIVLNNLIPF